MANARLVAALVAILVILLEVSTCAMARHHGKPDPCSSSEDDGSIHGGHAAQAQEARPPSSVTRRHPCSHDDERVPER
jgi:hypothetical protein